MATFKVGDRVKVIDPYYRNLYGRIGEVVSYGTRFSNLMMVMFNDYSPFPQKINECAVVLFPSPTIPGDDTLADANAAAEQRAEWADYGEMEETETTNIYNPLGWRKPLMMLPDYSRKDEAGWYIVGGTNFTYIWRRYPLLSADYD
jgi:hypothetical protein